MKQLIIVFISIISLSSCKAQNNMPIMQLDIENFERKTYYDKDSTRIQQFIYSSDYVVHISKKDSLHKNYYNYNNLGRLIKQGKSIKNGSGQLGKWYEYDNKGNITKVTDYDLAFTFTLDSLQAYAKRNEIDLLKTRILKGENTWELDYLGRYRGEPGEFFIVLDKNTGEEILVKQTTNKIKRTPILDSDGYIETFRSDTIYYKGQPYKQK